MKTKTYIHDSITTQNTQTQHNAQQTIAKHIHTVNIKQLYIYINQWTTYTTHTVIDTHVVVIIKHNKNNKNQYKQHIITIQT